MKNKKPLKLKSKKGYYVTTPIYYPTAKPHLGSAYTTIAADILARWHKLLGEEVFFLTGTDEHTKKVIKSAQKENLTPQEFTDKITPEFKRVWEKLNIKYDRFIRTSDLDHKKFVEYILKKVYDKGDIYKGIYEGLYCTDCEAYYTEKDLIEGNCPIHKRPVEAMKEETYFFKLSKYQKQLLNLYEKNKEFISPSYRKNEIINRVKEELKDLSISRKKGEVNWGVELPFDSNHICYVWFDALVNYLTGIGILENPKLFKKFWPANVHLVGKDILWFHSVIWPAMLFSAEIEQPKRVYAHGWLTVKGNKIGKSAGNAADIDYLINSIGVDSLRYFLFRHFPFGNDGEYEEQDLINHHNNELANKLGNLVSRVLALAEKYGTEEIDNKLLGKLKLKLIEKLFENYEFDKCLNEIFSFIDICNQYVQDKKPWETHDKKVLYELLDSIKVIAILLSPFMPETCEKIAEQIGFKIDYNEIGKFLKIKSVNKGEILFKKIESKEELKINEVKNNKINFTIDESLIQKGFKIKAVIFKNVKISNKNKDIEEQKKQFIKNLNNIDLSKNKILLEYKRNYPDKTMIPSAEALINLVKNNSNFPNINNIVDSYNLISVKTFLAIGAHDVTKIKGNLKLIETKGNEKFIPLGKKDYEPINKGEYACIDDEKVLCRLDIKQCDETKITKDTKDLILYIQGNKETSEDYLNEALNKTIELITKVSNCDYEII